AEKYENVKKGVHEMDRKRRAESAKEKRPQRAAMLFRKLRQLEKNPPAELSRRADQERRLKQNMGERKVNFLIELHCAKPDGVPIDDIEKLLNNVAHRRIKDIILPETIESLLVDEIKLRLIDGDFAGAFNLFAKFKDKYPEKTGVANKIYRTCLLLNNCPKKIVRKYREFATESKDEEYIKRLEKKWLELKENKEAMIDLTVDKFIETVAGVYKRWSSNKGDELVDFAIKYAQGQKDKLIGLKDESLQDKQASLERAGDSRVSREGQRRVNVGRVIDRAQVLIDQGSAVEAERAVEQALERNPGSIDLIRLRFEIALTRLEKGAAEFYLRKLDIKLADRRLYNRLEGKFLDRFSGSKGSVEASPVTSEYGSRKPVDKKAAMVSGYKSKKE
ncbi:MAG: hypothetical protein ABII72_04930, partial [Parcubacteria group bacterium]